VILTIMVTPIITSVTREVFETVPGDLKEGAYALGATRWEMVREVVLPTRGPASSVPPSSAWDGRSARQSRLPR